MKPIAIFVLVAAFSAANVAASAKNATAPGNTDERIIAGVAGPRAAAETAQKKMAAKPPSKDELRKAKIRPKPRLQDPN